MRRVLLALAATAMAGAGLAQDVTAAHAQNDAVSPKGNAASTVNASGTVAIVPLSALEPGANSFTEAQARARLEGAGLAGVSGLHQDAQGIWRGRAVRNGTPIEVGFDYKGNIAAP